MTEATSGTSVTITGAVKAGEQEFTADWMLAPKDAPNTISLSWTSVDGSTMGLADVCKLFGASITIPDGLDVKLTRVTAAYEYSGESDSVVALANSDTYGTAVLVMWRDAKKDPWQVFFGVAIPQSIALSDLPLIGKDLASVAAVSLSRIQAYAASNAFDAAQAGKLTTAITGAATGYLPPVPVPPAAGMSGKFAFSMHFQAGSFDHEFTIGAPAPTSNGAQTIVLVAQDTPAPADDGTHWFNVQKTFGPVTFQKVGIRYKDSRLWALMNASLAAGGLTITLMGLGAGSKLTTFAPAFTIDGIQIDFAQGPVSISGGLQGTIDPVSFTGELVVKTTSLTIGALGAYAEFAGHPSFFLYAMLDYPLGGPAFFFVTGLALGFGFNRSLVIPDITGVATFPFVQWATGSQSPPSADPMGDVKTQVDGVLQTLTSTGVVAPSIGEYWLAAGIRFTSFELVDSFALLTVTFGNDFEIALLGLSTMQLPPSPASPVAVAQLALKASFSPKTGLLAVVGQLTPASYVLSTDCHITGGFAFNAWFSGAHEGEFVLTLGGYSPRFTVPDYYPVVPRLGLNWQIDSLTISGDEYFALTSNAIMAGGGLSAVWSSGGISAWFDVQADFLMTFAPFHYYLSASIRLGCSFSIDLLFTTVTISIHIGVGLEIWGPSFAGDADIDLSIVSFTISFGDSGATDKTTIEWHEFVSTLLPTGKAPPSKLAAPSVLVAELFDAGAVTAAPVPGAVSVIHVVIADGLLKTISDTPSATPDGVTLNYVVDPRHFVMTTRAVIPSKLQTFQPTHDGVTNITLAPDSQQPHDASGQPIVPRVDFGVGPVGTPVATFQPTHVVTINPTEDGVSSRFHAIRTLANVPKALWELKSFDPDHGVPVDPNPLTDTTIPNVLVGFQIVPAPLQPAYSQKIDIHLLQYTIEKIEPPFAWTAPDVPTADDFTKDQTVSGTIEGKLALANRQRMLDALAAARFLAPGAVIDVDVLKSANYLLAPPVLSLVGEAKRK